MRRTLRLATAIALGLAAAPAFAAQADIDKLHSYVGVWTGTGSLQGAEEGDITCRITFRKSGPRVSYQGRCTLEGQGSQLFNGTLAYNDDESRYESRSSAGTFLGRKQSGDIVFVVEDSNSQGTFSSTMRLRSDGIRVDFAVTDPEGAKTSTRINFTRS